MFSAMYGQTYLALGIPVDTQNKIASTTQTTTTPDAPAIPPATAVRGGPTHSAINKSTNIHVGLKPSRPRPVCLLAFNEA